MKRESRFSDDKFPRFPRMKQTLWTREQSCLEMKTRIERRQPIFDNRSIIRDEIENKKIRKFRRELNPTDDKSVKRKSGCKKRNAELTAV